MKRLSLLTLVIVAAGLSACVSPFDATDPLPYPADYTARKDLSVDPGDSFFDYCNGTWLKNHPIPAPDPLALVSPRREVTIPERIGEKGTWVGLCRERWP